MRDKDTVLMEEILEKQLQDGTLNEGVLSRTGMRMRGGLGSLGARLGQAGRAFVGAKTDPDAIIRSKAVSHFRQGVGTFLKDMAVMYKPNPDYASSSLGRTLPGTAMALDELVKALKTEKVIK